MLFGPSGHVHDLPNQLFLTLKTQQNFKHYNKSTQTRFQQILFRKSHKLGHRKFGQDVYQTIHKIRLIKFWDS